ncbi:MAG: molecular chaperone [Gammaproteobacteria bacterium]|nr:molecular chaperone [Gammaproteobacteria bacterium]
MNNKTKDMTSHAAVSIDANKLAGGSAESLEAASLPGSIAIDEEQSYRASAYSLLAGLFRSPPDQEILDQLSCLGGMAENGDDLMLAMSTLALSAQRHSPDSIEEEFYQLFIGLGKGEVVPYGSWYLTGFLMEKPLSDLRDDLNRLGYQRNEAVVEPEDHVAALCEVMSIMISDATELSVQKQFFQTHMLSWMQSFFNDLGEAGSSVFYKAVARFGAAYIALEKQYFSMQS